jgi:hypothetical protein
MNGFINNEWDRENLNFLMQTDTEELEAWYAQATLDDLVYAQILMTAYRRELALNMEELMIEAELETGSFPEANSVLDRFRV